jgi:hypothetical protein
VAGVFLAAAGICAILPFVENAGLYVIVIALGLAAVAPAWFDWISGRLDYFEPVHWFGMVTFVYFGLGAIWTVNDPGRVAYDIHIVPFVALACFYCLIGYLSFLVGYYAPFRARTTPHRIVERPRGNLMLIVTGAAGLAGFVAMGWGDVASSLGIALPLWVGMTSQLYPMFLFSWALSWVNFYSGMSTKSQRIIMFGGLIPGVVLAGYFTFSDKSLALTLVSMPVVARWYTQRKMPWTFLIVLLLVLIFIIFPLYNTFRWFDAEIGRGARVGLAYEAMREWDSDSFMRFSFGTFKRRLAMINSVAVVVRDTPQWVPYARGSTIFMPAVAGFIPRAFWPDKPIMQSGREFGRTFRVTNYITRATHIGPTITGELYWNFGLIGVIVGMAAIGSIVRMLYRRYGGLGRVSPVALAIHIVLLVEWVHFVGAVIANGGVVILRLVIMLEATRWLARYTGLVTVEEAE